MKTKPEVEIRKITQDDIQGVAERGMYDKDGLLQIYLWQSIGSTVETVNGPVRYLDWLISRAQESLRNGREAYVAIKEKTEGKKIRKFGAVFATQVAGLDSSVWRHYCKVRGYHVKSRVQM